MVPQEEVNALVYKIKTLINKHGGMSDKLAEVRKWFHIFTSCPEAGSFVVLESEVNKLYENDIACKSECVSSE